MLSIVATPIGNYKDITLRALEVLKEAEVIIGEEKREASTLLKKLGIEGKELYLLNEHSSDADLNELLLLCRTKNVALISDCGTPSFYDPGFQLVARCRQEKISIVACPGASSLMTLMSLVSKKIASFYFAGFLPADSDERRRALQNLFQGGESPLETTVLMDTPYRLLKLLSELAERVGDRLILLGINLTQTSEMVLEGTAPYLLDQLKKQKLERAEFILVVYGESLRTQSKKPLKTNSREQRNMKQGRRSTFSSVKKRSTSPPFSRSSQFQRKKEAP